MKKTKITLYHPSSSGSGFKQWSIWRDGSAVTVEWGKVGGTLQRSTDVAKPKGKVGTKSYMDEEACAKFNYDRQIRKKVEEGYRETMTAPVGADVLMGLTKTFVPAKPRADLDLATLLEMEANGELFIQRKRDGQRLLVLIDRKGDVHIYSRRLDDLTDHFPLFAAYVRGLGLPRGTILDGEGLVINPDGSDNFRALGTITRAKAELASLREAEMALTFDGPRFQYMVFDILWLDGKPVWQEPYSLRHGRVRSLIGYNKNLCVFSSENLNTAPGMSPKKSLLRLTEQAKREGWEGLVCWFRDEPTVVREGGKPKRAGCAKWKVKFDYDVIATSYELGSGNQSDVVGAVLIAQYAPDGTLRSCGKCGTGFDMETRKAALKWKYPVVIAIESDGQEPDSGAFRFPVFLKRHEDKLPEECIGVELENEE